MSRLLTYICFVFVTFSCQNTELIDPDFLKIYLSRNTNDYNILVIDAFSTQDDGLIIFAIRGNIPNKFERVNELFLFQVDKDGNEIWKKTYSYFSDDESSPIKYGFPSNIVEVKHGFELFWSDYNSTQKVCFTIQADNTAPKVSTTTIPCLFTQYACGSAYIITPQIASDDYLYLNSHTNSTRDEYITFIASSEPNKERVIGQYITNYAELLPNIHAFEPLIKYNNNFWISLYDEQYYLNVPYNNSFAIINLGNTTPVYSDSIYWASTCLFYDKKLAVIITPHNDQHLKGRVYFAPEMSLNMINQTASSLNNIVFLPDLTSDYPTFITSTDFGFIVGGTSTTGSIYLYAINYQGQILNTETFGSGDSYELNALRMLNMGQYLAVIGTTKVDNQFQRAFFLKLKTSELTHK